MLLGGLLVASNTMAEACPPPNVAVPEHRVSLSTGMAAPIYSNELSRARLTVLAAHEGVAAGAHQVNTGLTRSRAEMRITPQVWEINLGAGRHCIGLGRLEADWRIEAILVDIASEYAPGGCNYRIVREHEDEHVAFARQTYTAWTPRIEAALRDAAARIKPVVARENAMQAAKDITTRLMQALQPAIDGFRAELRSKNASIDTASNYRLVNGRCPRW